MPLMPRIRIHAEDSFSGEGKTRGLDRGLILSRDGTNLAGEGMGIGCPAVRHGESTVFASICSTETDPYRIVRTYRMDRRMSWTIRGRPAPYLSAAIEGAVWLYRHVPPLQRSLLLPAGILQNFFCIRPLYLRMDPVATAVVTYEPRKDFLVISALFRPGGNRTDRLYLFNELQGDIFCSEWNSGGASGPPPGWKHLGTRLPTPWLSDRDGATRFRLHSVSVSPACPWTLFWGRECTRDLCWAGFAIETDTRDAHAAEITVSYHVELKDGAL
ncbi:MAG: hypothetical protein LUQ13_01330 [Methanomicrobiales archaeon]|nr:hypothetical protein [Methanomicrobiales archaeon]